MVVVRNPEAQLFCFLWFIVIKMSDSLQTKIESTLLDLGFNLVEYKKFKAGTSDTLRLTINDPKGHVGHAQCTVVSKAVRHLFDEFNINYNLEVWSPGVGRELKTEKDFQIFKGKLVDVKLGEETLQGDLQTRSETELIIDVEGESQSIPLTSISKVSLALDKRAAEADDESITEISVEDI